MITALIIGSDTPVGQSLQGLLEARGGTVVALSRAECKFRSERQAKKVVRRSKCDFVVDTRLQSAVDGGVRVHDVEVDRCQWLAKACHGAGISYLYLSSARVFSGDTARPYSEEDYPDSSESVARMLLDAEERVRKHCEHHIILRLGPVFGSQGINVLSHMLTQLTEGGTLELGSSVRGSPLTAGDGARVISALLDQYSTGVEEWGVYHYCSSEVTSCFEFGEVLLASASQFSEFASDAVQLARSPEGEDALNRVLDCTRIRDIFAIKQVPWRTAMAPLVSEFFQAR